MLLDPWVQGRFLFIVMLARFSGVYTYTVSDANSLHTALFTGYNSAVLPECPITVKAEYNLLTVKSLDTTAQTLTTSGWFTVVWTDSRLSWTPSSYGNIEYIFVPQQSIWHPEFHVENSVTDLSALGDEKVQVRIKHDGEVLWNIPAVLFTSCDIDVTFFPYDSQTCDIKLVSWGFHNDTLNLTFYSTDINLQDYRINGEWNLESTYQYISEIMENELSYSELVFKVNLKRHPWYYILSILFPVILISALSAMAFLLPVESGEKLGYILTVILALAVLLLLFEESMPTTSVHTSVLVVFLIVILTLATIVIIITVLIIRLYHKEEDYTAPKWMYKLAHKFKHFKCSTKRVSVTKTNTNRMDTYTIVNEKGHQQESIGHKSYSMEKYKQMYPNKDLAEIFDDIFKVVFIILYIVVVSVFTITLKVA